MAHNDQDVGNKLFSQLFLPCFAIGNWHLFPASFPQVKSFVEASRKLEIVLVLASYHLPVLCPYAICSLACPWGLLTIPTELSYWTAWSPWASASSCLTTHTILVLLGQLGLLGLVSVSECNHIAQVVLL